MIVAILILLLFVSVASLMFLRKLPAIIALPILALGIGLVEIAVGHLSVEEALLVIVANGSQRLIEPIIITIFGGTISVLLQKSGVAENLVKVGAELAGASPLAVSLVVLAVVGILFTTITGLGAVIMIGTVVLPILASVGVRDEVAGGVMLFGISLGGLLNVNNWAVYKTVLLLDPASISSYALVLFLIQIPIAVIFIIVELWRTKTLKLDIGKVSKFLLFAGVSLMLCILAYFVLRNFYTGYLWKIFRVIAGFLGIVLIVYVVFDRASMARSHSTDQIKWYSYLIPLIPLFLILVFHVEYIAAFLLGFLYSILVTLRPGSLQLSTRSLIEGVQGVAPVIVLIIEIGMLLSSILGPSPFGPGGHLFTNNSTNLFSVSAREWPVLADIRPFFQVIIPRSFWQYTLGFGLLAPLALYRGPMNVWGLGYGVAGILLSTGQLTATSIMGILMAMSIVQGISDPTNTQNVWLANELRVDVNALMWRTLPYAWATAFIGLVVAGLRFL